MPEFVVKDRADWRSKLRTALTSKHTITMNEAIKTGATRTKEIKLTSAEMARFWAKVNKNGPTMPHMDSPCWTWTPSRNLGEYGRFRANGKFHKAHRLSWMIHRGEIPHDGSSHGICACHRCDNPSCVNPAHLFLGTHADNVRDRELKGRRTPLSGDHHWTRFKPEKLARGDRHRSRTKPETLKRGEAHGQAKLTSENVIQIRELAMTGMSATAIGKLFGLAKSSIQSVIAHKTWRHIL